MKTNEKYGAYEAPRVGGTKMKKLLFITYMAALAALVGCQQDDELHTDPIPYVTFSASEEPKWSSGFPHFIQFKSELGNKEFMI